MPGDRTRDLKPKEPTGLTTTLPPFYGRNSLKQYKSLFITGPNYRTINRATYKPLIRLLTASRMYLITSNRELWATVALRLGTWQFYIAGFFGLFLMDMPLEGCFWTFLSFHCYCRSLFLFHCCAIWLDISCFSYLYLVEIIILSI